MDIKITGAYNQYLSPPIKNHQMQANPVSQPRSHSDSVSLSSQAEDYKTAMRAIQVAPDIRLDVVNNLKEMIAAGTYNVSAHDVAARIFQGLDD